MNYSDLRKLQEKLYFSAEDVAALLQIKTESAQVLCSRYAKKGIFIRLKKNFYVLENNWTRYKTDDFYQIANFLQVPSYISCISALAFYDITTQVPREWYESISLKRTIQYSAHGAVFYYFKIKSLYYFGFIKAGNTFIANKEKAFLDACHLSVFGDYAVDWSAVNINTLDKSVLDEMLNVFPDKTKCFVYTICKI